MADNLNVPGGSAGPAATDEIGGIHFQRIKLVHGADGVNAGDVATGNPLPVGDAGGSLTVDNAVLSVVGGGTEATAQRVTIATDSTGVLSVDDNGASLTVDNAVLSVVGGGTEATAQRVTIASDSTGVLTIDSAQLPASLGQSTMANSMTVTIASNQSDIPVTTAENTIIVNLTGATINSTGTTGYSTGHGIGGTAGGPLELSVAGTTKAPTLQNITLRLHDVDSGTSPAIDVIFFSADPTATTFADKAAYAINSADYEKVSGIIKSSEFNWSNIVDGTTDSWFGTARNLNCILTQSGGTIYAALIARSSFTLGGDDLISATFGFTGDV